MIGRCSVTVLILWLVSGCAVDVVSPKEPITAIPDHSSEIAVGQMERAAVRAVLGEPQFSSAYWEFDLFRAKTDQTDVVAAVTPWPIPFARIKDQLHRYTLVAYNITGRTSAVATGIFRKPPDWRNVSPISSDFLSLHLRAGELMFFVDPEGARDVNLLAASASRDAFLQHASKSTACTVILGCGDRGCGDQLAVDSGPVRRLPVRNAHAYWIGESEKDSWLRGVEPHGSDARMPWLETLVAVKLTAGEHLLEFSAKHLGGKTSLNFTCHPGELTYLTVNATDNENFMNRALVDWRIDRTNAMPEPFRRRPLVLLDDGQWYVDAEPGQ